MTFIALHWGLSEGHWITPWLKCLPGEWEYLGHLVLSAKPVQSFWEENALVN